MVAAWHRLTISGRRVLFPIYIPCPIRGRHLDQGKSRDCRGGSRASDPCVLDANSRQQILATAHYSDGSLRDVTSAAGYSTNAALVADVNRTGVARTGQVPGEAAIAVHYMGQVASVQFQVPRTTGFKPFEFPPQNEIDELVRIKLEKMQLVPSAVADDATFLRRVYIDTIGCLPTPEEVRQFLADPAADKRAGWIDKVLDRPEYADYWALVWADILLVDRQTLGERGAYELHHWLREQFVSNRRYDQWVTELITALRLIRASLFRTLGIGEARPADR